MTEAEFELLPREIGWKYEYWDGCAHIRPGHLAAKLTVSITPRPVAETGCRIRSVALADAPALKRAFVDGFGDTVEYCDRSRGQIRQAGYSAIETFFAGQRGDFHPASRLAVPFEQPRIIAGAALVVQKADGPFLDMLFVRARWRHQGLGTALTATVMNALLVAGETRLGSAYNVANLPSIAWHEKFGFSEVPDAHLAALREQIARHDLWRRERQGDVSAMERQALVAEIVRWERLVTTLTEAGETERRAAAAARR